MRGNKEKIGHILVCLCVLVMEIIFFTPLSNESDATVYVKFWKFSMAWDDHVEGHVPLVHHHRHASGHFHRDQVGHHDNHRPYHRVVDDHQAGHGNHLHNCKKLVKFEINK